MLSPLYFALNKHHTRSKHAIKFLVYIKTVFLVLISDY